MSTQEPYCTNCGCGDLKLVSRYNGIDEWGCPDCGREELWPTQKEDDLSDEPLKGGHCTEEACDSCQ